MNDWKVIVKAAIAYMDSDKNELFWSKKCITRIRSRSKLSVKRMGKYNGCDLGFGKLMELTHNQYWILTYHVLQQRSECRQEVNFLDAQTVIKSIKYFLKLMRWDYNSLWVIFKLRRPRLFGKWHTSKCWCPWLPRDTSTFQCIIDI